MHWKRYTWTGLALFVLLEWPGMAKDMPSKNGFREGLPLVYSEDFEKELQGWVFTDDSAWEIREDNGNRVLALHKVSQYRPPVRSPLSIGRIEGLKVSDFILEARMKQIGREYGHRDLCVFFGYNDPSRFYYCHIATKADDHAHSVFIVDGKPRLSIARERTDGTDWGTDYHKVRIVRRTESGLIQVFFNDMETPIMTAEDKTFLTGEIGFGSFDDEGYFDDIRIWGKVTP